jgi:hypothetical protein
MPPPCGIVPDYRMHVIEEIQEAIEDVYKYREESLDEGPTRTSHLLDWCTPAARRCRRVARQAGPRQVVSGGAISRAGASITGI